MWAVALALGLLFCCALFGLMPLLFSGDMEAPPKLEAYDAVSVIRHKKPEAPPRERKPEEPKPERPPERRMRAARAPSPEKPRVNKPRLAFKVNASLPSAPGDLALPDLAHFSLGPPPPEPAATPRRTEYAAAELDAPITPVHAAPPVYPFRARKMGIEGHVTVRFVVDETGGVHGIEVVEAEPTGIFEKAVLTCMANWRFSPPTRDGRPVRTVWQRTIEFTLR